MEARQKKRAEAQAIASCEDVAAGLLGADAFYQPGLTLEHVRAVGEARDLPAIALCARREVVNYFAGLRFVEKNASKSPPQPTTTYWPCMASSPGKLRKRITRRVDRLVVVPLLAAVKEAAE